MPIPIEIKENSARHWTARVAGVAAIAAVVYYLYLTAKPSTLGSVTEACVLAIVAVALNLLLGYNGQISIGHSAFAGLAAFTSGYTVNSWGWSPYKALLAGIILCFVLGVALGMPALRLKGPYLALVTLAVAFVWPTIAAQFLDKTVENTTLKGMRLTPPSWTGLSAQGRDARLDRAIYLYFLGITLLVISYIVVRNLRKSRVGRSLVAVRDNETAAAVMGVNLRLTKTLTFGTSAAIASLAGWLTAARLSTMDENTFTIAESIVFLLALFLGGAATLTGPIVGAFVYFFLNRYLVEHAGGWTWLPGPLSNGPVAPFLLAVMVIVFVFIAPLGLVGFINDQARRLFVITPRPLGMVTVDPELHEHTSPAIADEVQ